MPLPPPSLDFPPNRPPSYNQEEKYVLGVDEAGRGPVLGPLVYCLFLCPVSKLSSLKKMGAADSKVLTADKRESFFKNCVSLDEMCWLTKVVSPEIISGAMLRPIKYNLNELSFDTVFDLLARVLDIVQVEHLYVDTLGKPELYRARIEKKFPHKLTDRVTVAPKADSLYPIVSAASIVAKVTRDYCLDNWIFNVPVSNTDYGCGYPGDPQTVSWLHAHLDRWTGFPDVVRFSWSSCQRILDEKAIKVEFEGDIASDAPARVGKNKREPVIVRHGYTALSNLERVKTFPLF